MYSKRLTEVALLLALTFANGCHKPSALNATASHAGDQTSSAQPSANEVAADNVAANATTAPATQGTQSAHSDAPRKSIIPAGTPITVRLQERLSSASAVPGERFEAVIGEPVVVGAQIVVPIGAAVQGHVIVVRHSGRLHHAGELGLTLDTVTVDQQIVALNTSHVVAVRGSHKKRNWGWIGGGTGGGAVIGALAAGGRGALIGSGTGAAAGMTTALITGKKDVVFGNERRLRFRLNQDVSLFG